MTTGCRSLQLFRKLNQIMTTQVKRKIGTQSYIGFTFVVVCLLLWSTVRRVEISTWGATTSNRCGSSVNQLSSAHFHVVCSTPVRAPCSRLDSLCACARTVCRWRRWFSTKVALLSILPLSSGTGLVSVTAQLRAAIGDKIQITFLQGSPSHHWMSVLHRWRYRVPRWLERSRWTLELSNRRASEVRQL